MLAQMIRRLKAEGTFEGAIEIALDDVIALHGAEYGNLQLPIGEELAIVAQRGHPAAFLRAFRRVKSGYGCACGRALRLGTQVVIHDVEVDPEYAPYRDLAKIAGYRSVQTTPLVTEDGALLGLISTHFANPHEPTPIEMETLREYSVVAAEYLFASLGDASLAAKAEQMSDKLYADYQDR
jgi:GAF domain-containing protein